MQGRGWLGGEAGTRPAPGVLRECAAACWGARGALRVKTSRILALVLLWRRSGTQGTARGGRDGRCGLHSAPISYVSKM